MCADRPKMYLLGTLAQVAQGCPAGLDDTPGLPVGAKKTSQVCRTLYTCLRVADWDGLFLRISYTHDVARIVFNCEPLAQFTPAFACLHSQTPHNRIIFSGLLFSSAGRFFRYIKTNAKALNTVCVSVPFAL
jgi:hypothetical protein